MAWQTKTQGEKTVGENTICHNIKKIPRSVREEETCQSRAEEEKEARKRKRIEAKENKDKLVPAVTTVKRKLFTKTGVDSSCSSCHKTTTSEIGRGLRCDDCNIAFHGKCIPEYHKEQIPIS